MKTEGRGGEGTEREERGEEGEEEEAEEVETAACAAIGRVLKELKEATRGWAVERVLKAEARSGRALQAIGRFELVPKSKGKFCSEGIKTKVCACACVHTYEHFLLERKREGGRRFSSRKIPQCSVKKDLCVRL